MQPIQVRNPTHDLQAILKARRLIPNRPVPATKFTLFLDLPFELRVGIWRAVPESRVIQVHNRYELGGNQTPPEKKPKGAGIVSLLGVCRESRGETLATFKPLYRPSINLLDHRGNPPLMYLDARLDILLLNEASRSLRFTVSRLTGHVLETLQHLILDVGLECLSYLEPEISESESVTRFNALDRITLVLNPVYLSHSQKGSQFELYEPFKIAYSDWPPALASGREYPREQLYNEAFCQGFANFAKIRYLYHLLPEVENLVRSGLDKFFRMTTRLASQHPNWRVPEIEIKGLMIRERNNG